MKKPLDRTKYEKRFFNKGFDYIVGIDESGRGAGAGPILACAVIINKKDLEFLKSIENLRDSKKLSSKQRSIIYKKLINKIEYSISSASVNFINKFGINKANKNVMEACANDFSKNNLAILVDGNLEISSTHEIRYLTKGDDRSLTIAAASIIAKVQRDSLMTTLSTMDKNYLYSWHQNYGYLTKSHIQSIKKYGITEHHRNKFISKFV